MIVTGASGFVGRYLLDRLKDSYEIFALARRSQEQCGAPEHPNIHWSQVDIAEVEPLGAVFNWIRQGGPVEAVIHLAAHYDFSGRNSVEYRRTNVDGLLNTLELSRTLGLRRFIFASSVAACRFTSWAEPITEDAEPNAQNYYARSKKSGEGLVKAYGASMPTCIVRFAAVFSDWCEYPPMFNFLSTWLSRGWNARMIGGKGTFAIPYIHIRCAVSFLAQLLRNLDLPESGEIFIASPDGAVCLRELFDAATLAYFGRRRSPVNIPKTVTRTWMQIEAFVGNAIGKPSFEQPWMARYLDRQLVVDASRTRARLDWANRPRFDVVRRMPFLVENHRTQPIRWTEINQAALRKEESGFSLKIHWLLEKHEAEICSRQVDALLSDHRADLFGAYRRFDREAMGAQVNNTIRNLRRTIRTREMEPVGGHCRNVARLRIQEGFEVDEVCAAFSNFGTVCVETLKGDNLSAPLEEAVTDRITMAIQFGIDEIIDEYEIFEMDHGDSRSLRY